MCERWVLLPQALRFQQGGELGARHVFLEKVGVGVCVCVCVCVGGGTTSTTTTSGGGAEEEGIDGLGWGVADGADAAREGAFAWEVLDDAQEEERINVNGLEGMDAIVAKPVLAFFVLFGVGFVGVHFGDVDAVGVEDGVAVGVCV